MGNYKMAFHVAGAPPILGAILMFFIPKVQQVSMLVSVEEILLPVLC